MSESKASVTWQENKAFMGISPSGHNVQIDA
ncbi:MAG TPA: osmotically inducible protein OsmC, partial [Psychrobacter sp.]|nr:osmotically inducible protein OsmC [Psychrobacter sp.]